MLAKPRVYIQVHAGHMVARRIGGGSMRRECAAFNHPRTLMGDFMAVETCFRAVLKELATGGLLSLSPAVVVHLVPEAVGGYTNVEERAFQEAALAAGARVCRLVSGRSLLSDSQVADILR
jgi:hypothetical protein